jgi:hypothetical protein
MMHRNQINDDIIGEILTGEELKDIQNMAKLKDELSVKLYAMETKVKKGLDGRVIGDIERVNINHIAPFGLIYFSYVGDVYHTNSPTKKWWQFWKKD